MSWYRREVIFSGIMALMLIAVLGTVSYLISPQTEDHETQFVFQTPETLAFTLTGGNVSYESPTFENQTIGQYNIDWLQLEFEFLFTDKYPIHEPYIFPDLITSSSNRKSGHIPPDPEFHGEFEAKTLQSILVELFRIEGWNIFLPENISLVEVNMNTTIRVSLRTTQIMDLGVKTWLNERTEITSSDNTMFIVRMPRTGSSCSGFWKTTGTGGWTINADQLSSMLQGNGTALITFDAAINASVRYELRNENVETGELTLSPWEGRLGIIEIVYEQGKITWIRYSFSRASLTLLTTS